MGAFARPPSSLKHLFYTIRKLTTTSLLDAYGKVRLGWASLGKATGRGRNAELLYAVSLVCPVSLSQVC